MVSLDRENFDVCVFEAILQCFSNVDGVSCYFFVGIVPHIVSRVVSNPSDEISFKGILVCTNEIEHVLQGLVRNVAVIISPFACKWRFWVDKCVWSIVSAADRIATVCRCSLLIEKVNMWI